MTQPAFESSPQPRAEHRALLRFRSDAVARLTGIEFTKVKVRKGIWHEGAFHAPSIALANMYAQKVAGGALVGDRSIWNVEAVERWVGPDDLYEQLLQNVGKRVSWGQPFDWAAHALLSPTYPIVSTAPLPITAKALGLVANDVVFPRAPIKVMRQKLWRANVYQTVYFPEPESPLYRASITGDTLICEYMASWKGDIADSWPDVINAFGLNPHLTPDGEIVEQQYGKIAPVHDAQRRELLFRMTQQHRVYSLGRFATWRNILLDDVVQDVDVIKRLMRNDGYAHAQAAA
jgi:hypothetical protein